MATLIVLVPNGKSHTWKLAYNPAANGGKGTLSVTLANECVVLNLDGRHRAEGTYLDRFGMLTSRVGGGQLKVYFDDLQYTTGGKAR